jgi:hypothetical protein
MHGKRPSAQVRATGKLRIGDDWNASTIIALSQENPLKAVAEFVENSIDAGARNVTITRGRERGEHYLMIADDGAGVPRDAEGAPDFRYVATHICDSIKRRRGHRSRGVPPAAVDLGLPAGNRRRAVPQPHPGDAHRRHPRRGARSVRRRARTGRRTPDCPHREQKRAEDERTSRDTLRAIQRAFREAMISLPTEEYDWFDVAARRQGAGGSESVPPDAAEADGLALPGGEQEETAPRQRQFFEYAGPLHSARIAPASCALAVGTSRGFRAVARDAKWRPSLFQVTRYR